MANLSDATGTFTFHFNKNIHLYQDTVNAFIHSLSKVWSDGEYNTLFYQLYQFDKQAIQFINDDEKSITLDFSGCGRNEYSYNLDWYFGHCNHPLNISHYLPLLGNDIRLESVKIGYTDVETGQRLYIENELRAEMQYEQGVQPYSIYTTDCYSSRELTRDDLLEFGYDEETIEDLEW